MTLQVIANFSDVSNLWEDGIVSGATNFGGEKYFIHLCQAEKNARAQMKFNFQGVVLGGEGRYGVQLA